MQPQSQQTQQTPLYVQVYNFLLRLSGCGTFLSSCKRAPQAIPDRFQIIYEITSLKSATNQRAYQGSLKLVGVHWSLIFFSAKSLILGAQLKKY